MSAWLIPITDNRVFPCFVGSGECKNKATHIVTSEKDAYVCAHHAEELETWDVLISEMTPEKVAKFAAAVEAAHKKL